MTDSDDSRRCFELLVANFQSISKTQKSFLVILMSYLGLVWAYAFSPGGEVSIQILGVSLRAAGFWPITPSVLTILSLGFVGSINALAPVWAKLKKTAIGSSLDFYDLDTQKNILDYLTFLTIHPEKRLEDRDPRDPKRRFDFRHFLYPLVLLGALYTTYHSRHQLPLTYFYRTYVVGCILIQAAFSLRIYWRAVCRFFRIRGESADIG